MKKRMPRKEKLLHSYQTVKMELGRRPTYLELHKLGTEESKEYRQEFKSYIGFLAWSDELTEKEKEVFMRYESWLQEVALFFHHFLMEKEYRKRIMILLLHCLKSLTSMRTLTI